MGSARVVGGTRDDLGCNGDGAWARGQMSVGIEINHAESHHLLLGVKVGFGTDMGRSRSFTPIEIWVHDAAKKSSDR